MAEAVRTINVEINGQFLRKDGKNAGVQGEANVTRLHLVFDDSWTGKAKRIIWRDANGEHPVAIILDVSGTDTKEYDTMIPGEPLAKPGWCSFTIEGYGTDPASMAWTVSDYLAVAYNESYSDPAEPTPSQALQLSNEIGKRVTKQEYDDEMMQLTEEISTLVTIQQFERSMEVLEMRFDSNRDGKVDAADRADEASVARNGMYPVIHFFELGPNYHTLEGPVPTDGVFTVCFTAVRGFTSNHQDIVRLNGNVDLTMVARGLTEKEEYLFRQNEFVVATVVMESATAGKMYIESIPCLHRGGGHMQGSVIIDTYQYENASEYVDRYNSQARNITISGNVPSGGKPGDVWMQYQANGATRVWVNVDGEWK